MLIKEGLGGKQRGISEGCCMKQTTCMVVRQYEDCYTIMDGEGRSTVCGTPLRIFAIDGSPTDGFS